MSARRISVQQNNPGEPPLRFLCSGHGLLLPLAPLKVPRPPLRVGLHALAVVLGLAEAGLLLVLAVGGGAVALGEVAAHRLADAGDGQGRAALLAGVTSFPIVVS